MSGQINQLTQRIARLNLEIATIEGGGLIHSDATGLRDQRYRDLEELATYMDINVQEQANGAVAVFVPVAVTVSGKFAVDLWGGHTDATRTDPWRSTLGINLSPPPGRP